MDDRHGRAPRIGGGVRGLLLSLLLATSGCAVGDAMHVTRGVAPANVDASVRFRTTYYFRTFDYCWNNAAAARRLAELGGGDAEDAKQVRLQDIIPETDIIYRYRMTGKASALFNQVRFESGTLNRTQIDPFGAGVSYDADAKAFRVGGKAAATEVETALAALKAEVADLRGKVTAGAPPAPPDPLTERVAAMEADLKAIRGSSIDAACKGVGGVLRRGFQVMGPEGIKTFDQNERLVMAMTSSAKPLIETLQEYSGRILNRQSGAAVLLPLARENVRIVETSRAAERTALPDASGARRSATDVFDAAIAAFGEK